MLDIHSEAMKKIDEGYHYFLLRYSADAKIVYGFVEGKEDPMFYKSTIERFLPEDWAVDLIKGGSKEKVCKTFDAFDWSRFSTQRIAFFLDTDLDIVCQNELKSSHNIYYTDGYSIENSIATGELFVRLMSEVYNVVDLSQEEVRELKRRFAACLDVAQSHLSPVMAQISIWRSDRTIAHLNNIDLNEMFYFESGQLKLRNDLASKSEIVSYVAEKVGASVALPDRLAEAEDNFEKNNGPKKFTRGKFLIWVLGKALEHFHSNIANLSETYKTPPKLKISVGPANVMIVAAPRARCPKSLREFIERTFHAHIQVASGSDHP